MTAYSLTPVERQILAQQHRILAELATDGDPHQDREGHERWAEVLEHGFVSEYDRVFEAIEPELAEDDCKFVLSVLSMFRVTEHGFRNLTPPEREQLGEHAESRVQFSGFDGNEKREIKMMGFVRYLMSHGGWSDLAPRFTDSNSHMPMLDTYTHMLAKFREIRDARGTSFHHASLTVDELQQILDAGA